MPHIHTNIFLAREVFRDSTPDYLIGTALEGFNDLYRDSTGDNLDLTPARRLDVYADAAEFADSAHEHLAANGEYRAIVERTAAALSRVRTIERSDVALGVAKASIGYLLDGKIIDTPRAQTDISTLERHVLNGPTMLSRVGLEPLDAFIKHYFEVRQWQRYRSSIAIAQLLRNHLAAGDQRLLQFSRESIPDVAQVFEDYVFFDAAPQLGILKELRVAIGADLMFPREIHPPTTVINVDRLLRET